MEWLLAFVLVALLIISACKRESESARLLFKLLHFTPVKCAISTNTIDFCDYKVTPRLCLVCQGLVALTLGPLTLCHYPQ